MGVLSSELFPAAARLLLTRPCIFLWCATGANALAKGDAAMATVAAMKERMVIDDANRLQ